jgi:hypothetical protein
MEKLLPVFRNKRNIRDRRKMKYIFGMAHLACIVMMEIRLLTLKVKTLNINTDTQRSDLGLLPDTNLLNTDFNTLGGHATNYPQKSLKHRWKV